MKALARFASSDAGRLHATTCERYGLDPAAGLPSVLAVNLRAALAVLEARRATEDTSPVDPLREWEKALDGNG